MLASGAEVVKIAVTAERLADCLTLRAVGQQTRVPIALVAMGDAGIPSRVLASWFGSCWTYAGDGAAPGQISAQRMTEEFGVPPNRIADRDLRRARPPGRPLGVARHAQRGVSRRAPRCRVSPDWPPPISTTSWRLPTPSTWPAPA